MTAHTKRVNTISNATRNFFVANFTYAWRNIRHFSYFYKFGECMRG